MAAETAAGMQGDTRPAHQHIAETGGELRPHGMAYLRRHCPGMFTDDTAGIAKNGGGCMPVAVNVVQDAAFQSRSGGKAGRGSSCPVRTPVDADRPQSLAGKWLVGAEFATGDTVEAGGPTR